LVILLLLSRRSSAAVAAAVGMPLAQPHNARRI
jgi:hypothetical protein